MKFSRRHFLMWGVGGTALALPPFPTTAQNLPDSNNRAGCLVDSIRCIGCRQCEEACNRRNQLPPPSLPFSDRGVFATARRPSASAFTVVNCYPGHPAADMAATTQTFCKFQCQHCLKPACVSACIVGALTQLADGAVVYNKKICIGCRYCMIACPFQIPAYEYQEPLRPRVRKCEFCAVPQQGLGANPACAAACPTEALVFGKRGDLLQTARARIVTRPGHYLNHIYGEHEAGGTSWLYLAGRPFSEIGLLSLPAQSPAVRTESIQHGVYRYGLIPLALYGLLGGLMWRHRRLKRKECAEEDGENT
jgi:Fe-S-cluster-containing dehydrogenase component